MYGYRYIYIHIYMYIYFFCKQIMLVDGSNGSSGEACVCAELLEASSARYRRSATL